MQIIIDVFNLIFFAPIVNLLIFILRVLEASHIPGALGFSIIFLTVVIRVLVWPFMSKQLKSAKKMSDLKPKLDELKIKHKGDKQSLAKSQMELYKEHGVNPTAGCLPAIIQIPIILALYQVISSLFNQDGINRINELLYVPSWSLKTPPSPDFFGLNLASKPSEFGHIGWFVLLVPVITAVLQLFQSRMMMPLPIKNYPSDSPKEKKEKESTADALSSMQGQMMYLMPVMIGYFAFSFPIGLALYWNTFTILGIFQQYRVSGWGALKTWLNLLPLKLR